MTTDVQSAWDDLDTLVFERDDLRAALAEARQVLDRDDTRVVALVAPPALIAVDDAADQDDELWLASLPAPTRAVLESAKKGAPAWPQAPRISHAIAQPAL